MKKNFIPALTSILLAVIFFSTACHKLGESPTKPIDTTKTPPIIVKSPVDSLKIGLVAYYAFNSSVIDSSVNKHDATPFNLTSIADRYANPNAAYYFNGTTAYASVPDKTDLRISNTDFTLNFWIKLDNYSLNGSNVLAKHLSGNDNGWVLGINGVTSGVQGTVRFGPGGYSASANGTKVIPLNQWHMVTATYNNSKSQLSIFVDGVFDNVTNNIPSPNAAVTSMLYIGRDDPTASSDGYFVKGGIDEIRIYNRILSQTQITKLYLPAPVQPVIPTVDSLKIGLITRYAFNAGGVDSSGNANTASLFNLTARTDRFNKANAAYNFNGYNGYASVADNTALRLNNTDFTLSVWINLSNYSLNGGNVLAKHLTGNDNGWVLGINGATSGVQGTVRFGPGGYSASANGKIVLNLNQWHMVTTTYAVATHSFTIYVDGILDNTTPDIPSPNATINSALYIGRDEPTASQDGYFVNGGIDEVRIYGRVLNTAEIQKLLVYKY